LRPRLWTILLLGTGPACFAPVGPSGGPRDATEAARLDAGASPLLDATAADAEWTEPPDAQAPPSWDAAAPTDAGLEPDASTQPDASSPTDASTPDGGVWDPMTWCLEWASLVYSRNAECVGGSVESWARSLCYSSLCAEAASVAASGTLDFREDLAESCLAFVRNSSCEVVIAYGLTDCVIQLMAGSVPIGGACHSDFDCAFGSYCSPTCGDGTCAAWDWYRTCAADADCPSDLVCAPNGFCRRAPEGHACSSTLDCDSLCFCGAAGVCEHRRTEGEACPTGIECDRRHYCAPVTADQPRTCQPPKKLGEPCEIEPWNCEESLLCAPDDSGTNRCQLWPVLGEPCAPDVSPCMEGFCDTSLCVPFLKPGEPCESDIQCARGHPGACLYGVCLDCGP